MAEYFDPDKIEVEWDSGKDSTNQRKHGISFENAASVFFDPLSLTVKDSEHSSTEIRYNVIGSTQNGELLVVTFTEREIRLRIISARLATRSEKKDYEESDQF